MNILVNGRDKPTAVASVYPEGVIIRIDFEDNLAAWCEIQLSEQRLQDLLDMIKLQQAAESYDALNSSHDQYTGDEEVPF